MSEPDNTRTTEQPGPKDGDKATGAAPNVNVTVNNEPAKTGEGEAAADDKGGAPKGHTHNVADAMEQAREKVGVPIDKVP